MISIKANDIQKAREALTAAQTRFDRCKMRAHNAINAWWPLERAAKRDGENLEDSPEHTEYLAASADLEAATAERDSRQNIFVALCKERSHQIAATMAEALASDETLQKYDGQPLRYKRVQAAIHKAVDGIDPDCSIWIDTRYGYLNIQISGYGTSVHIGKYGYEDYMLDLASIDKAPDTVRTTADVIALVKGYAADVAALEAAYKAAHDAYRTTCEKYRGLGLDIPAPK